MSLFDNIFYCSLVPNSLQPLTIFRIFFGHSFQQYDPATRLFFDSININANSTDNAENDESGDNDGDQDVDHAQCSFAR